MRHDDTEVVDVHGGVAVLCGKAFFGRHSDPEAEEGSYAGVESEGCGFNPSIDRRSLVWECASWLTPISRAVVIEITVFTAKPNAVRRTYTRIVRDVPCHPVVGVVVEDLHQLQRSVIERFVRVDFVDGAGWCLVQASTRDACVDAYIVCTVGSVITILTGLAALLERGHDTNSSVTDRLVAAGFFEIDAVRVG